ncbi:MAG: hypothetical protein ACRDXX_05425, partial [Stackebrandtia sp.]
MRRTATYVEADVGMADDHTTAAWVFDVDLWGRCGQGPTETAALSAVAAEIGDDVELVVEERIIGDEQAFARDHRPATREERAATLAILDAARRETLALISA